MRIEETNEMYAEKARRAKDEANQLTMRLNEDQAVLDELKLDALKVVWTTPTLLVGDYILLIK